MAHEQYMACIQLSASSVYTKKTCTYMYKTPVNKPTIQEVWKCCVGFRTCHSLRSRWTVAPYTEALLTRRWKDLPLFSFHVSASKQQATATSVRWHKFTEKRSQQGGLHKEELWLTGRQQRDFLSTLSVTLGHLSTTAIVKTMWSSVVTATFCHLSHHNKCLPTGFLFTDFVGLYLTPFTSKPLPTSLK